MESRKELYEELYKVLYHPSRVAKNIELDENYYEIY